MGSFRVLLCALLPSWASPQQASCPYIDVEGHPHQFGMLPRSSPNARIARSATVWLCSQGWLKRMPASAQTSRATTASSCSIPVRPSDSVTAQRTNNSRAAAARWMVFGSESAFGAAARFCCFKRPDSSWQPCGSELQSWTPVTEGGARLVFVYLLLAGNTPSLLLDRAVSATYVTQTPCGYEGTYSAQARASATFSPGVQKLKLKTGHIRHQIDAA